MRVSINWLQSFLSKKIEANNVAHLLTMAGLEVGSIEEDPLQSDNKILSLELTPNRGDCLSMLGVAREVALLTQANLHYEYPNKINESVSVAPKVDINVPTACPLYAARIIKNVDLTKSTPDWLQARLISADINLINIAVDIINYVMLEFGQPMHAFDADKITGTILVRMSKSKEKITLLDGHELELDEDTLVIADSQKAIAIAGIMGSANSAVSDQTKDIILESAFFDPIVIGKKARQLGIITDSSYRFERGVNFEGQILAINKASLLLQELAGGKAGPITLIENKAYLPEEKKVICYKKTIEKLIGISIADDIVLDTFKGLGFNPKIIDKGWEVEIPSHRFDIKLEIDLIEELCRIYGYDRINKDGNIARISCQPLPEEEISVDNLSDFFIGKGYQEVITYSFVNSKLQDNLLADKNPLYLLNPISNDMDVMRVSLWPGLLQTLKYNLQHQKKDVRIFETGLCFAKENGEIMQTEKIAALLYGDTYPLHWDIKANSVDFYDLKGDIESLLKLTLQEDKFYFKTNTHKALHPGRTASLFLNTGELVGWLGVLHPEIASLLDIKGETILFEGNLALLKQTVLPKHVAISKFPAVRRDLALLVADEVQSADVCQVVKAVANNLIQDVHIFDVYKGEGVESGKKSLAIGLTLQHQSRTLTDKEIDTSMDEIVEILKCKLSATMRD